MGEDRTAAVVDDAAPLKQPVHPRGARLVALDFVGVATVVAFCGLSLWVPFGGDTSLFAIAARTLNNGGLYYRDFWDIKQPGIYWFYQVADLIPGPLWVPARLLQGLWLVGLALLVLGLARARLTSCWVARLAPAVVVLPLILGGPPRDLGVPEQLIGLPLLGSFALVSGGTRSSTRRAFWLLGGGLLGAVAVLLKLPYVVVILGVVAVVVWPQGPRDARSTRLFLTSLAWYVLGLLLPLLAVAAFYAGRGELALLLRTNFEYPVAIAKLGSLHTSDLYSTFLTASVRALAPLVVLAAVALVRPRLVNRRITFTLVVWIVLTVPVVAVQKPNPYQPLAFVVPLGLLAVLGMDELAQRRKSSTGGKAWVYAVPAVALVAAGPLWLANGASWLSAAISAGGIPTESALLKVAPTLSSEYATLQNVADAAPRASASSLYVLGDPLLYVILDRPQAIEVNGWSPEFATPAQWVETERELNRTLPELVYVDAFTSSYLTTQAPSIEALLARDYIESASPRAGDHWYLRRPSVAGGPTPPTQEGCLLGAP